MTKHKTLVEEEMGESVDNSYVTMNDNQGFANTGGSSTGNNNVHADGEKSFRQQPAPAYNSSSTFGPSYIRLWQIAAAIGLVVVLVLVIVLGVLQSSSQRGEILVSCKDIRDRGRADDGYYFISPGKGSASKSEVYCDMTTDGGGWTLVASIHEDNIHRKCDSHDMWSRFIDRDDTEFADAGNWVNDHSFGDARKSTSRDFKSPAYSFLQAKDVMIWHARDGTALSSSQESAFLRYHTTNGFLENNGGNLLQMFSRHQKLTIGKDYLLEQVNVMADAMSEKADEIASKVTNFHRYTYDGNYDYRIESGGGMFSRGGNQVSPRSDRCYGYLDYGENKTCDQGSAVFTTRKSLPFVGMALFTNEFNEDEQFGFRVRHNRPRTVDDEVDLFKGNMTLNGFKLEYFSNNIYSNTTTTPTVSELHFVITNEQLWNSSAPRSYRRSYSYHSTSLNYYNNEFTAIGGRNLIIGYILLATKTGLPVPKSEVDEVVKVILGVTSGFNNFIETQSGLAVPVTFAQGNEESILKMSPPQFKNLYDPGYIQFAPHNAFGYPNAICPGVRVRTMHPEYLCVGGVAADDDSTYSTCGDFAGWNGISSDSSRRDATRPSGWAHSQNDIFSSILIFYR